MVNGSVHKEGARGFNKLIMTSCCLVKISIHVKK